MKPFTSSFELLGQINPSLQVAWLASIPFAEWPFKEGPVNVVNRDWHDFEAATNPLIETILENHFQGMWAVNRALEIVVPGFPLTLQRTPENPNWLAHVRVPLLANPYCLMWVKEPHPFCPEVNIAYLGNNNVARSWANYGGSPSVHLTFDAVRPTW